VKQDAYSVALYPMYPSSVRDERLKTGYERGIL